MIGSKELFGYLSLFLSLLSITPYIWTMLKGETRPHIFSWIIWCVSGGITAALQYSAHAGPGAWSTMLGCCNALVIILLSLMQKADWSITRTDWAAFLIGIAIIPLWLLTHSVLLAALLAVAVDLIAYYPTFRKSYHKPHQEMIFLYFVTNFLLLFSVFAMEAYSVITLVMPVTIITINTGLILMLIWRRRVLF